MGASANHKKILLIELAVEIDELQVTPAETEGQLLMVHAELVRDGRGDIMNVHEVFCGRTSHGVGCAIGHPAAKVVTQHCGPNG